MHLHRNRIYILRLHLLLIYFVTVNGRQNMRYLYHNKNRFIHKKKKKKKLKVCGKKQIEFLATASCNFIMQILSTQCIALALGNPLLWPGAESCGPTASKIRSQVTQFQLSLFHNCIPGVY